jgi:serine/threonine protein kinase/Tfp pilus assembly protein PilF
MIGKLVSHYEIIEKLGEGGMGVVYRARDTKLKRTVALKFLPPELTRDPEVKERFIREAQAASALQHHNICTIHDIDETPDDQLFIVMDCYDGETLKEKMVGAQHAAPVTEGSAIPLEQAISITIQIAEGLAKAHEKGIIHRDIKPANIFITNDGIVKILDFGLAKLAGQAQLTKDSSTLGTVAYMSPEQLSGKEIDQRTDIWSLGVVLYEMLAGELPFKGDYEQAIVYAILNEEPKSMESIPSELQNVLRKALFKNPEERHASTAELLNDLTAIRENYGINERLHLSPKSTRKKTMIISAVAVLILIAAIAGIFLFPTAEPEASIKSLAVLPFTNLKNEPETDYLGPALAADIIKDLAYLNNLNVLPFSAVRDIDDWTTLKVEHILTGNYLKEANNIRLSLELIRSANHQMIWNGSIEDEYENTFKLQDKVSDKVIKELRIQFAPEEQSRMHRDISNDPLAYEYYLKSFAYPYTVEGSSMAIEMLKKSIQIDSTYAPAYYELGYHTGRISQIRFGHSEEYIKAEKYLMKAISLNKDYIDARTELGGFYTETGNADKALKITKEALKINPNNAWTHFRLSYIFRYTGMNEESVCAAEKALTLMPDNPRFRSVRNNFLYAGDFQRALEVSDLDKTNPNMVADKGLLFLMMGDTTKAIEILQRSIKMESDSSSYTFNLVKAYLFHLSGRHQEAIKCVHRIEDNKPYDGEILFDIASLYGFMGDYENCVRVLNQAVNGGFYNYPFFLIDPFLDPVRDDPEFNEVLALAKEKHEAFKQIYYAEEE